LRLALARRRASAKRKQLTEIIMLAPRISVFPKCYFDELYSGKMNYLDWLRQAATLGGEGVEHYDGFFKHGVEPVRHVLQETGQISSMLCFSPDFTHPDPGERQKQVERQRAAIDLCVALDIRHCRTLSGQRFPDMTRQQGIERTVESIRQSLEYAETRNVILCMENHYKDGNWQYPEFAQPEDIFLEIVGRIDSPFFGVQFDPSNAVVGGFDPVAFLEKIKMRVVTMHASDRYLAPGATLDELRQSDGSIGYSDKLRHGETGKGLNDYDAIFRILKSVGFSGWISVEDGMSGLDELRRSVAFLKEKRTQYYPASRAP
jgi:sugar phosphate isomerase/epimerase